MASSLTWLDYSERDRRRALDVIDLFRETGTVDELGLGAVRDSFSDLFFPGTSTTQTRACYFLLVPWTFRRLEQSRVSSSEAADRFRREEILLNEHLLKGEDTDGVFGARAGASLKRLPSEAYWGGLGSWGIHTFSSHKWAYFRSLDGFYRRLTQFRQTPRDPEGRIAPPANWHAHLPEPPTGFPRDGVTVALRREDAEYLRDQIQAQHPQSLLAVLVHRANRTDLQAAWPWESSGLEDTAPTLRERLHDAELFAVSMQGAALLYNLMLSEQQRREDRVERYQRELTEWAGNLAALEADLRDWPLRGVWQTVQAGGRSLGYPTQSFVQSWVEELQRNGPTAIVRSESGARVLVKAREAYVKRGRARLTNPRYLELWGGESGTGQMEYRWGPAKRILQDIFDGLARSEGDARDT
ncbi:MAG: DUF6361 family protein [bacterium]|nr:DUF6361 family protein [bacterium]